MVEQQFEQLADTLLTRMVFYPRPGHQGSDYLTMGRRSVLLYLYFGEDGVTAGELSRCLKVTTPCIAAALNCLEEKDWISRKKDPSDKRKVLVYITDAGKDGIIKRHHAAVKHMAAKLSQMGEADAKEYVRLSLKMAEIESNTQPLREDGL